MRRQLSRMEGLVDKYGSIPQNRLATMSRPASRGPGLLLINPSSAEVVSGRVRGRSQSVVAATSAKDMAAAVALAGGGGALAAGAGAGRTMPASQRPFLQLSTSAGAIGATHHVTRRSGASKRLPPVLGPLVAEPDGGDESAVPQRLSTPEMDRLRGQLQAHHEKLAEQLATMSELLRRF